MIRVPFWFFFWRIVFCDGVSLECLRIHSTTFVHKSQFMYQNQIFIAGHAMTNLFCWDVFEYNYWESMWFNAVREKTFLIFTLKAQAPSELGKQTTEINLETALILKTCLYFHSKWNWYVANKLFLGRGRILESGKIRIIHLGA